MIGAGMVCLFDGGEGEYSGGIASLFAGDVGGNAYLSNDLLDGVVSVDARVIGGSSVHCGW